MKNRYTYILFFIFGNLLAQESKIAINNPSNDSIKIYNYDLSKLLYADTLKQDSITVASRNYKDYICLYTYPPRTPFSLILLNKPIVEIEIDSTIAVKNNDVNNCYLEHVAEVRAIENQIQKNNLIFSYYYQNNHIAPLLEYLLSAISFDWHSKDSLMQLYNNIDSSLHFLDEYKNVQKLISVEKKYYKVGDTISLVNALDINLEKHLSLKMETDYSLIFWASWCAPCLKQLDIIKKYDSEAFKDKLILINLDSNKEMWVKTSKKLALESYHNFYLKDGFQNEFAKNLKLNALPRDILLNKNNVILDLNHQLLKIDEIKFDVFFENNSYELDQKNKQKIINKLNEIDAERIIDIKIQSFCDDVGNLKYNEILASYRSSFIENFLQQNFKLSLNIKKENIGSVALQSQKDIENQRAKNRKSTITILYRFLNLNNEAVNFDQEDINIGEKFVASNIYFKSGQDLFLPSSSQTLRNLLEYIKHYEDYSFEIQGHICCYTENIEYGYELSTRRAKKVYDYLVKNGVDKDRLSYIGLGISSPLNNNIHNPQNRRVEVLRTK